MVAAPAGRSGPGPGSFEPLVVYLTGRRAGSTVWPVGEYLRIGTFAGAEIPLTRAAGEVPAEEYGTLRRVEETYELDPAPGKQLLVNGDPVDRRLLETGDVIEVGPGGPLLRFRLYPAGASGKRLRDAMADCLDCARKSGRGRWGRLALLARGLPREFLRETSRTVRLLSLVVLVAVIGAAGALTYRTIELERQLAAERSRVAGLAELLEARREAAVTPDDLAEVLEEIQTDVSETARRLRAIEDQSAATRLVIAAATRSTVFLQGAWGFVDPETGQPLRVIVGPSGAPVRGPGGDPLVTTDERAPVLEALFTGTAFIVSGDGHLLTNRHIVRPWDFDDAARRVAEQGWVPVMRRLIAYVPGVPDSLPVQLVAVSDSADLALLHCTDVVVNLPALPLAEADSRAGDEIVVLGYPLGMRALMARADPRFLAQLREEGDIDFWTLGARLARTGQIMPLASRGIVGQVNRQAVVYDAETTSGGSGGPVLSMRGEVLAVTSAILPEFGGSNLGVPIARARTLLTEARPR